MGASINSGGRRGRGGRKLVNEINVTPMVDVMLVLLIIFMITAPMMVSGIKVDLPKTESAPINSEIKPLVISINKDREIFIFKTKIEPQALVEKLKIITKEKSDTRIFVKGDKSVAYGVVVETMAKIKNAGFSKVALISEIK